MAIIQENNNIILLDGEKIFNPTPKLLTNTEEFRTEALAFQEYGYYTKHKADTISGRRYWEEMKQRCLTGYTANGTHLSGYNYFYLNFSPILKVETEIDLQDDGEQVGGYKLEGFPEFWDGDNLYFTYLDECEKAGKHAVVLKCRRRGFSFKNASMMDRNYYMIPQSRSYAFSYSKEFLLGDGILTKAWNMMDFIDLNTAWGKRRQYYNQALHRRASYKKNVDGIEIEHGYKSEIIGVTLQDEVQKIRGKAGKLMLFEEAGMFPGLLEAWNIAIRSMQQGRITYGLMVSFGTGGTEGADFMALESLFNRPKSYSILPCTNIWSKVVVGNKYVGFFSPEYINREGCMDKNGNSQIDKAKLELENKWEKLIKDGASSLQLARNKAEEPVTPEEACLRVVGSMFPVDELRNIQGELLTSKVKQDTVYIGKLFTNPDSGEIEWKQTNDTPIINFPITPNDPVDGCLVIWQHPVANSSGIIPFGRYIAGLDPYDDDGQEGSLASSFIFDTWTDKLVAEYTGRPLLAEQYYDNLYMMLKYYSAKLNYENNKKGLFAHFSKLNALYMLEDTLKSLRDIEMVKGEMIGNKAKGYYATIQINKHGRELIKSWLMGKAYGEEEDSSLRNMHKIRSSPLLDELIHWNPDPRANFDRISALVAVMLYRDEVVKRTQNSKQEEVEYIDDFFLRRGKMGTMHHALLKGDSVKKLYGTEFLKNK